MKVYSDESWRGDHSRYTFDVFYSNHVFLVDAKIYRKRKDGELDCVYHRTWETSSKDELKTLNYDGLRLSKKFINSDFFVSEC